MASQFSGLPLPLVLLPEFRQTNTWFPSFSTTSNVSQLCLTTMATQSPATPGLQQGDPPFLHVTGAVSATEWSPYAELYNENQLKKETEPVPKLENLQDEHTHHHSTSLEQRLHTLWMVAFLPLVSYSYLIFCFVVHYRTVVINTSWIDPSMAQLNTVKAGITTISIVIVSIALLPLYTLLSTLKGEEFFRILGQERGGVPLRAVNDVSTPAFSLYRHGTSILRRQSSGIFSAAFLATLVVFAASALAPATLSAERAYIDSEMVALRVGAVTKNSVVRSYEMWARARNDTIYQRGGQISQLPWMETVMGTNYKWMAPPIDSQSGTTYAIPTPPGLPSGTAVRYLTDVMAITPTCQWTAAEVQYNETILGETGLPRNRTMINLPNLGTSGIRFEAGSTFDMTTNFWSFALDMQTLGLETYYRSRSFFEDGRYPLVDSSTIWVLQKCDQARQGFNITCPTSYDPPRATVLDMDGLPRLLFNAKKGYVIDISILVCSPNLKVETREVVITQNNHLLLRPRASRGHIRQRNLDEAQSQALMKEAMGAIAISSGPSMNPDSSTHFNLGGESQVILVFGADFAAATSVAGKTVRPLPIATITSNYAKMMQTLMKGYLDGTVASRHVPARMRKSGLVFASSFPHLIVSTIIFFTLSVFLVLCHFREPIPQFTLISAGASLSGSDCPDLMKVCQLDGSGVLSEAATLQLLDKHQISVEGKPGQSRVVLRATS